MTDLLIYDFIVENTAKNQDLSFAYSIKIVK